MSPHFTVLRWTFIYLLIAGIWLLIDPLLDRFDALSDQLDRVKLIKDAAFVLFSSALLYHLLSRQLSRDRQMQVALRSNEERLRLALESSQDGLWEIDQCNKKVYFSPAYSALLGLTPEELGSSLRDWIRRLHPDDRIRWRQEVKNGNGEELENTYRLRHQDGSYRWVHSYGRLLRDHQQRPYRFIGVASDVTRQREISDILRQAAAVFCSTQEGVLVADAEQRIIYTNPAFTRITGYEALEIVGQMPGILSARQHDEVFYQELRNTLEQQGYWSGEVWSRRKTGEIYPQWQCVRAIYDEHGQTTHYVAVFSDISALKRSQSELDFLAHYDPLSRLPNRLLFTERASQALERTNREKSMGAVLLVNLDRFKQVNESFGHTVGDQLLKAVGERLRSGLAEEITLARLGDDEFGLLVEHCPQASLAANLAERMQTLLEEPFMVDQRQLYISASIGISLLPDGAENIGQVLRNASSALLQAKSNGREGYAFYTRILTEYARRRIELGSALRQALENDELRVYYQPIQDLDNGQCVGMEALVRWQHPERGLLGPDEFVPIAEENGLVEDIDTWVLNRACQQMAGWLEQEASIYFVAVNISSRLFGHTTLDVRIAEALEHTGLDPSRLELEITESAIMEEPQAAQEMLLRLGKLGVRLTIDDFGTGYSSLARLKKLPVQKLKIDRSFVQGLPHDTTDVAIVRTIITLGRSLGLQVVAEGIRHQEQVDFLRQEGCQYGQGYLFGRPRFIDVTDSPLPGNPRTAR